MMTSCKSRREDKDVNNASFDLVTTCVLVTIVEVFYGNNYWSPIITSKNSSEILSYHNKQLCFICFQDKMWIKMPKWTIFLISSEVFVLITESFWQIFWRTFWQRYLTPYKTPAYIPFKKKKLNYNCSNVLNQ